MGYDRVLVIGHMGYCREDCGHPGGNEQNARHISKPLCLKPLTAHLTLADTLLKGGAQSHGVCQGLW